jgi:hypothetical protein
MQGKVFRKQILKGEVDADDVAIAIGRSIC